MPTAHSSQAGPGNGQLRLCSSTVLKIVPACLPRIINRLNRRSGNQSSSARIRTAVKPNGWKVVRDGDQARASSAIKRYKNAPLPPSTPYQNSTPITLRPKPMTKVSTPALPSPSADSVVVWRLTKGCNKARACGLSSFARACAS
ncbi:Uncharacterised protein [Vibrio cholerae]|nr:Uncharacterised protein [Vibrio cholerae]CSC22786.1 Uncharacterised protein [Vibrio cholerae]